MTPRKQPPDPRQGDQPEPATASVEGKIAELEAALAEARDRHLRLAADFDNYKKRARLDQLETMQHASAELIGRLLPVLDDLRNVRDHKPDGVDEAWGKGRERSGRKLEEGLGGRGLRARASGGGSAGPT